MNSLPGVLWDQPAGTLGGALATALHSKQF